MSLEINCFRELNDNNILCVLITVTLFRVLFLRAFQLLAIPGNLFSLHQEQDKVFEFFCHSSPPKALLSWKKKQLFFLLKSTQYCYIDIVEVDRSPRGGKVSPFSCPGAGNRPTNKKKTNVKSLGICQRGIVIGGIEPRINRRRSFDLQSHFSFQSSTTLKNVIKERFYTRWLGMLVNPPFLIISRALFSQCLAEVCSDVAVLKYFRRVENCL